MLRQDRVALLVAGLIAELEAIPEAEIVAVLPAGVGTSVKLLRRFRIDLLGDLRASAINSLRALPDQCARDPERAQRILDRTIGVVAWLDDQTDEPPAALLS